MKKSFFLVLTIFFVSLLAACTTQEEVEPLENDALITFLDKSITVLDAETAQIDSSEDLHSVAKDLLFQELVLIEAEQAGIGYDEFDLDALVNQTQQLFEFDEEAILYLTTKSELYNISPEEYIETIWRESLRKKLILNNYIVEEVDFNPERPEEDIQADIESFREQLLTKYEDQIEYHF